MLCDILADFSGIAKMRIYEPGAFGFQAFILVSTMIRQAHL